MGHASRSELRSLWIYPWDAHDAGIQPLVRRARDDWGLNSLSLAVSYHSAKFLLPKRSSSRVFLTGGSAVYFRPEDARYKQTSLRPIVTHRAELLDVASRLADACRNEGLAFRAWVVTLHNSRLGESHPQATEENVFGDRYPWALCPSNPEAREYAIALVRDIVASLGPDAIDLESAAFHGLSHGHHHELLGINYGPMEETLMSLCFCEHCRARARERGIDPDGLRRELKRLLETRFVEEAMTPPPDQADMRAVLSLLLSWPEFAEYIQTRLATVTSLIDEIRREAIGSAPTRLAVAAATFVKPASNAWLEGLDLRAVSRAVDEIILVSYFHDPPAVAGDIQFGREMTGDIDKLLVGLALLAPLTSSAENLRAKVEAIRSMGVSKLSFYNYGFVSDGRLDWLRQLSGAS